MGEDIATAGGAFKCTEGLLDTFGPKGSSTPDQRDGLPRRRRRRRNRPQAGRRDDVHRVHRRRPRPVDDRGDEAPLLSSGQVTVPLVVRASAGAGLGFGCQHSQMLDYWFRGVGGLKVCVVSNAQNAYGLLRAAIRDPDPVVVLEPAASCTASVRSSSPARGESSHSARRESSRPATTSRSSPPERWSASQQAAYADGRHVL